MTLEGTTTVAQPNEDQIRLANPDLSVAIKSVAADNTPESRAVLYQTLLQSTLILPTPESEDLSQVEDPQFLTEDEALTFMTYENDAGGIVMIAFTDEDAALTWEPEGLPYIGLRGLDLILIAAENQVAEIAINPASPEGYRMQQDEIAALAEGESPASETAPPVVTAPGTTVLVGPPDEKPPRSWREALTEILTHYPSVESAYLFQLHVPPQGGRNVIGLVLYEGMSAAAQERMMDTMLSEFEGNLPTGQALEFVLIDDPDFLRTVQDTVSPIYQADF